MSGTARRAAARSRDRRRPTYTAARPEGALENRFGVLPLACVTPADAERIAGLARLYLQHRFDLLGSGWVVVEHGMACAGVEGHRYGSGEPVEPDEAGGWLADRINAANSAASRRIWSLVTPPYRPIDWQLDFKSGYRWSESTWSGDIAFGQLPGVDVKVPWELARMQHLPHLAWAHALAASGVVGFERPEVYAREFRNQLLDFIAANPPRWGVNWTTTMDVGIRVANWLVSYDLFKAHGAAFDAPFRDSLAGSVYDHGVHIAGNLEWHGGNRANHYLANVAGLLFVAAYLPRSPETDVWLAFAVQELIGETEYQFRPDGANFEDSTAYHRLSAEMVLYGTALVLGLPEERLAALSEYDAALHRGKPTLRPAPLPCCALPQQRGSSPFAPWYVERLERMAEFTIDVSKSARTIHQVGDNDSGRFLKLWPEHRRNTWEDMCSRYANLRHHAASGEVYWEENPLDQRHIVAAVNGLFAREDFGAFAASGAEQRLVCAVAGGARFGGASRRMHASADVAVGTEADWAATHELIAHTGMRVRRYEFALDAAGREGWRRYAYPHFGLYIMRAPGVYLAVRCGGEGQVRSGAHAHNDQLALEMSAGDTQLFRDPGTYLYTPLPERRNAYRSASAHFVPRGGAEEPVSFDRGLFYLGEFTRAECLYFGPRGFAGVYRGYDRPVYRVVELEDGLVRVTDAGAGLLQEESSPPPFSPGYGLRDG